MQLNKKTIAKKAWVKYLAAGIICLGLAGAADTAFAQLPPPPPAGGPPPPPNPLSLFKKKNNTDDKADTSKKKDAKAAQTDAATPPAGGPPPPPNPLNLFKKKKAPAPTTPPAEGN
jgi:hypothetical protein